MVWARSKPSGNLGTVRGRKEMMDTSAMHYRPRPCSQRLWLGDGHLGISVGHDEDLTYWLQAVRERMARIPGHDRRSVRPGVAQAYPAMFRSTTVLMPKEPGRRAREKELEIEWFMNREFRLRAPARLDQKHPPLAIDFTRYDLKAEEPHGLQREWSLMNVLNQKGLAAAGQTDTAGQLSPDDQRRISHAT